jgi:hypothetical protein
LLVDVLFIVVGVGVPGLLDSRGFGFVAGGFGTLLPLLDCRPRSECVEVAFRQQSLQFEPLGSSKATVREETAPGV